MPKLFLASGEERTINTSMRYLSIIDSSKSFLISALEMGELVGEVGRQYELENINAVTFKNPANEPIEIDYEIANIKVHISGKGIVSVSNEVVVKRIVEAIQVNANATVENGKMALLTANNSNYSGVISIPKDTGVLIFPARDAVGRKVTLQVISDVRTTVTVGSSSQMDATKGVILSGYKDAIASLERMTVQPIYVYNSSADTAKIQAFEEYRT